MNNKVSGRLWLAAFAATAGMVHAPASTGHEVVAGWEGSAGRGYTFVAPSLTLHRGERLSWILRGSLSYLYYDFPEAGGDTEVRSPGQSLGLAFRYAAPRFTATVGPGYEVRQTRRISPRAVRLTTTNTASRSRATCSSRRRRGRS
jgi:hypothetical protein